MPGSVVGLDEIMVSQDIDLFDHTETDWIDGRSVPEIEPEEEKMHEKELTNLRVRELLHDLHADPEETILTVQDVDQSSIKYISNNNTESN